MRENTDQKTANTDTFQAVFVPENVQFLFSSIFLLLDLSSSKTEQNAEKCFLFQLDL